MFTEILLKSLVYKKMIKNNKIVISLGGSLIVPNGVDIDFVNSFISLIKEYISRGFSFIIITGGGKVCRDYDNSLKEIMKPSNEDLDFLGISVTRVNAEFIRISFGDLAYERIILDPESIPDTDKPVIVGGGWKPGNSSDLAAIYAAKSIGSNRIINLSNIDHVYDKDPRKYKEAKPIDNISWTEFMDLFPREWTPGENIPFDPIASSLASELLYEVIILNGKNIDNLRNYLDNKEFIGTTIK
jgi:uridylate kinase